MHQRTEATLEQMRQANWFCCVGVRDTEVADILSSWHEAVESCSSLEWKDLCLEAVNQYFARLTERAPKRLEVWNDIVRALKPVTEALVQEKTKQVVEEHNLPKSFVDTIRWHVLHVGMEAEYADVYPPGFYTSHAYWYVKGHFPCGYKGTFPKGRLIIY